MAPWPSLQQLRNRTSRITISTTVARWKFPTRNGAVRQNRLGILDDFGAEFCRMFSAWNIGMCWTFNQHFKGGISSLAWGPMKSLDRQDQPGSFGRIWPEGSEPFAIIPASRSPGELLSETNKDRDLTNNSVEDLGDSQRKWYFMKFNSPKLILASLAVSTKCVSMTININNCDVNLIQHWMKLGVSCWQTDVPQDGADKYIVDLWLVECAAIDYVISTSPFATTCKILSNPVHNVVFYVYIYTYIYTIYIKIDWSRLLSGFSNLIPPVGHGFYVHLRPRERTTTRSWWTPSSYQKLGRLNDQK